MFKHATTQIVRTAPTTTVAPYTGEAGDFGGATRAVEVAAMLGDSVVHVKHCMDAQGGKVSKGTWMIAALGAVSLLGSAAAFKSSVSNAGYNADRLHYHVNVRKQPAYSYRPTVQSDAVGFAAFGGLGLGLAAAVTALVRARSERKSPFYRVGTAPGVESALASAPTADFPLVAPKGDEFVFNYGAGFDGDLTVNGQTTSLADLAQSGNARPSTSTVGAIEIPIPANARIRAKSGNTSFIVSSVAKPAKQTAPMFANIDRRTVSYAAASLAVHLGIVLFLGTVDEDMSSSSINLNESEFVGVRIDGTEKEEIPPEQEEQPESDTGANGGNPGMNAMRLDEGSTGKKDAKSDTGRLQVAKNDQPLSVTRDEAIEAARISGFLGSTMLRDGISSMASDNDWSSGMDGVNVYGAQFGADGEGRGFGMGMTGFGVGGGCTQEPCGSIASNGYRGLIPGGRGLGQEYGIGPGGGPRGRRHVATGPTGFIGRAVATGSMDKEIIRRYIKRKADALAYCYEKQLLANPTLSGTVSAQFMIAPDGTVQASTAKGLAQVDSCVAGVIATIKFPAPEGGGIVQVTYPFNFHQAGQ